MSNEVRVSSGLQIAKGNLSYRTATPAFIASMVGQKGPTPGAITVGPHGQLVDLSGLTTPGWCEIGNVGETGTFKYGIYDPTTGRSYPWGQLAPGQRSVHFFADDAFADYAGTGSGGAQAETNRLWLRSIDGLSCEADVLVFEA